MGRKLFWGNSEPLAISGAPKSILRLSTDKFLKIASQTDFLAVIFFSGGGTVFACFLRFGGCVGGHEGPIGHLKAPGPVSDRNPQEGQVAGWVLGGVLVGRFT